MSTDYRLGKPQSKKITLADIDEKYWPEWFVEMRKDERLIIDDKVAAQALEAALNNKQSRERQKACGQA
jgi:DNA anti-recombination protein RmuC